MIFDHNNSKHCFLSIVNVPNMFVLFLTIIYMDDTYYLLKDTKG